MCEGFSVALGLPFSLWVSFERECICCFLSTQIEGELCGRPKVKMKKFQLL